VLLLALFFYFNPSPLSSVDVWYVHIRTDPAPTPAALASFPPSLPPSLLSFHKRSSSFPLVPPFFPVCRYKLCFVYTSRNRHAPTRTLCPSPLPSLLPFLLILYFPPASFSVSWAFQFPFPLPLLLFPLLELLSPLPPACPPLYVSFRGEEGGREGGRVSEEKGLAAADFKKKEGREGGKMKGEGGREGRRGRTYLLIIPLMLCRVRWAGSGAATTSSFPSSFTTSVCCSFLQPLFQLLFQLPFPAQPLLLPLLLPLPPARPPLRKGGREGKEGGREGREKGQSSEDDQRESVSI